MGSSISLAARTLAPVADAMMFCLADQPGIPPSHYAALARAWDGSRDALIATAFNGSVGPPVLFGRAYFDRLAKLGGDAGAKALLREALIWQGTLSWQRSAIGTSLFQMVR